MRDRKDIPTYHHTHTSYRSHASPSIVSLLFTLVVLSLISPPLASCLKSQSVCSGYNHHCLISESGRLYCWGTNPSAWDYHPLPVPDRLIDIEYSSVTCGRFFTCAIQRYNHTVDCFGSDRIDDGAPVSGVAIIAGQPVLAIALGDYYGLAIMGDGRSIVGWGLDTSQQLVTPILTPAQLALGITFRSVAAMSTMSCVLFHIPGMEQMPPPAYKISPLGYQAEWFEPWCAGKDPQTQLIVRQQHEHNNEHHKRTVNS